MSVTITNYLVFLLLAVSCCAGYAKAGPTGFSMLTKYSLLTFSTPTELANFTPRTINLPDEAHEAFVSITGPTTLPNSTLAVASDSFAVITETKVLVQRNGLPFKVVFDMPLFDRLLDITTIPNTSVLVAVAMGWISPTESNVIFLRSEDGGTTWTYYATSFTSDGRYPQLAGILTFTSSSIGYAAVNSYMFITKDGGRSWYLGLRCVDCQMVRVAAIAQTVVVLSFNNTDITKPTPFYMISQDGGSSWRLNLIPTYSSFVHFATGLIMIDVNTWVVTTFGGDILHTSDQGRSWNRTSTSYTEWLDIAYNPEWGVLVAAGYLNGNVLALSWKSEGALGTQWHFLGPSKDRANPFMRVVTGVPTINA